LQALYELIEVDVVSATYTGSTYLVGNVLTRADINVAVALGSGALRCAVTQVRPRSGQSLQASIYTKRIKPSVEWSA
jgi:glutathione S-transferase